MQRIIPREFGQKNPSENTPGANSLFFMGGILVFFLVVLAGVLFFFLIRSEKGKQEILRRIFILRGEAHGFNFCNGKGIFRRNSADRNFEERFEYRAG